MTDPLSPAALQTLLEQCTDFSAGSAEALNRYAAVLCNGQLASAFAAFSCPPAGEQGDASSGLDSVDRLATDLVKLPDRTLGVRGPTKLEAYPGELLPASYCSHLLRSLALGLRHIQQREECQSVGWSAFRAEFPCRLLESLLLNFREPLLAALRPWWLFAVALTATSADAAAALGTVFASMGLGTTEQYFLSCLAMLPGSSALVRLFGAAFRQPTRLPLIDNIVLVRGLAGPTGVQQLPQLMGFLRLVNPAKLRQLLMAGLRLFVDPTVVEAASPEELLQLCHSLAACLAALDKPARLELRQTAQPLVMRASLIWLDSGPYRRNLGKIYCPMNALMVNEVPYACSLGTYIAVPIFS